MCRRVKGVAHDSRLLRPSGGRNMSITLITFICLIKHYPYSKKYWLDFVMRQIKRTTDAAILTLHLGAAGEQSVLV
jgi:hypothetical protein